MTQGAWQCALVSVNDDEILSLYLVQGSAPHLKNGVVFLALMVRDRFDRASPKRRSSVITKPSADGQGRILDLGFPVVMSAGHFYRFAQFNGLEKRKYKFPKEHIELLYRNGAHGALST